MGMTIDEARNILEDVKEFDDSIYQYNKKYLESLNVVLNAARKYQKIEQIIKDHDNDRMPENYWYIDKIREVLEDGNNN